jgi:hypothetical protein
MIKLILLFLLTAITTQASSDGWTSSGGETLKDKINPWFLPNTKTVHYCILIDEANFGQTRTQVENRVQKTIQIWQQQLKNLQIDPIQSTYLPLLGTQEFIETQCQITGDKVASANADLYLQFGVLSGEQFRYLGDPTKYIGVTVRTDYDPVNLKAKGFIYFAPENGPLKLNKVGLIENPWSRINGALMVYPLLHEFGHLFGLQHNQHLFFMEEDFLEQWLQISNFSDHNDPDWITQLEDLLLKINFFKFDFSGDFNMYNACSSSASSSTPTPVPEEPAPSEPHSLMFPLQYLTFQSQPFFFHQELSVNNYPFLAPSAPSFYQNPSADFHNKIKSRSLQKSAKLYNSINSVFEKFMGYTGYRDNTAISRCYSISKKNGAINFDTSEIINNGEAVPIGSALNLTRFENFRDQAVVVGLWLPKEQKVIDLGDSTKNYTERKIDIGYMQTTTLFKGTYEILNTNIKRPFFIEAKTFGRVRFGGELDGVYYFDLYEGF